MTEESAIRVIYERHGLLLTRQGIKRLIAVRMLTPTNVDQLSAEQIRGVLREGDTEPQA